MRTIILTAALLCSASAFAQTTETPAATTDTMTQSTTTTTTDSSMTSSATTASAAPATEMGPTTKVLAKGDHYTVHRVMADGTVQVKVLTGDDAEMAMAGKNPPALAAFMSSQPITAGAGASMPATSSMPQSSTTTTTTTEQTTTETMPSEEPKSEQ